ncbi:MAG: aryl-sulfate sulfotransferase [Candidatus Heimdallarchaeota archaeon]|nr:aryl-sulfate sulfotransferase [Candidatus Heimdallarchaeota archaeon]MCK4954993.1 aryl-sulfate sulfotransferase [Candidatus Heimdallarchaeota archaeon]
MNTLSKKISVVFIAVIILLSYNSTLVQNNAYKSISVTHSRDEYTAVNSGSNNLVFSNIRQSFIQPDEMQVFSTSDRFEGYNLFVLDRHTFTGSKIHDSVLMVVDMEGNIIADRFLDSHLADIYETAQFINSTTVLFGSLTGAKLWNYYTDEIVDLGFKGHHEYEYNPNDNTFFTYNTYTVNIEGTIYYYDHIQEYDINGVLIWELDTHSFINESQWCPHQDYVGIYPEITHANSIFYDAEENMVYCNIRNTNTFYKIDHSTGEVVWGLGEWGNFSLFDEYGIQRISPKNLFYHTHSVEKISDNTFILFDNDFHNQTDFLSDNSRLLEITINEQTMTANVSWEWTGDSSYNSYYWSDADRLPNGNRLGAFGTYTHSGTLSIGARLVEVNNNGDIVWELNFPNTENHRFAVYRAERFRLSPIIKKPAESWFLTIESVQLTWQTWYNSKSREKINGSYSLFIEDILFDSGIVTFEQFWNPSNLSFNLGILPEGQHNITLVVADEAGHTSTDSFFVNVGDFFLEREGPLDIETGESDSIVRWNGFTVSALWLNLTINETLTRSEEWNDTSIELDLNSLSIGIHNITLQLFNNSLLIFNDSFWVQIFSSESPEILSQPNNDSIVWNSALILSWEIFDNSPSSWEVFVNDIETETGNWIQKNYILNWTLPLLDEGIYNITLKVQDKVNQASISSIWITILEPSPPIISSVPTVTNIVWGEIGINLEWEVHGGSQWNIWKNGSMHASGLIQTKFIVYSIDEWYTGIWFPGKYNLTLLVTDDYGKYATSTIWIDVSIQLSDPYADDVVDSLSVYYYNGENSLGEPDGLTARIFSDYGVGYLTLDMGENEEILNGAADDFYVFTESGEYTCWVGNDIDVDFQLVGIANASQSFDLSIVSLDFARYIRIQYSSGAYVELDAIEAIYYNKPTEDNEKPEISGPEDFWIWSNQSSFTILWEVFDHTHFNYSIKINQEIYDSGYWDGEDIFLRYYWENIGENVIALTLYDIFGNYATDIVNIEIREVSTQKTDFPFLISCLTVVLMLLVYVKNIRRKIENG